MVGRQDVAVVGNNMAAWLGSKAVDMAVGRVAGTVAGMAAYTAVGKAVGWAVGTVADSSPVGDKGLPGVVLLLACMVVAGASAAPPRVEALVVPLQVAVAGASVVLRRAAGLELGLL